MENNLQLFSVIKVRQTRVNVWRTVDATYLSNYLQDIPAELFILYFKQEIVILIIAI